MLLSNCRTQNYQSLTFIVLLHLLIVVYSFPNFLTNSVLSSHFLPLHLMNLSSKATLTYTLTILPTLSLALPTVASTAEQEPVVATAAPVSSVSTAATSAAAASVTASAVPPAAPKAPVVFKQLQQPRTYNGSTSWKDYHAHFERVCKVNGWITTQDKAQNLTLFLEGPAADVLKDIDYSAPRPMKTSGHN